MVESEVNYVEIAHLDSDLAPVLERAGQEELKVVAQFLRASKLSNPKEWEGTLSRISDLFERSGSGRLARMFGGKGTPYSTIVGGVAEKVGVFPRKDASVADVEWAIILKVLGRTENELAPDRSTKLTAAFGSVSGQERSGINKEALLNHAASYSQRLLRRELATETVLVIVGILLMTGMAPLYFPNSLCGPLLLAAGAFWLLRGLLGPAYSVIIPGVVLVGTMRICQQTQSAENERACRASQGAWNSPCHGMSA
jgi:uncharacterized protein YaaW (UPF0174 family)